MRVKIILMQGEAYYTEAECITDVADRITKGQVIRRYWYDPVTGDRWEEDVILLEGARLVEEETCDPISKRGSCV